jgi:hypothetical protein
MIQELENVKLIREFNYLKSEFEYKSSLVELYNIDFRNWVDKILNINLELKDIFEKNNSEIIEKSEYENNKVDDEQIEVGSDKLKNFYRQIVKLTHPDRLKGDSFNLIYNEANIAFKNNNPLDMLLLCDRLGLSYDLDEEEKQMLRKEISDLRNKIIMLESTYPYQWAIKDDDDAKNMIALNYIKKLIL